MIASFGDNRDRYRTAEAFQAAVDCTADQSKRESRKVCARWAATLYIKQTFHEYAGLSINDCEWAKSYYNLQLSRGKSKQSLDVRCLQMDPHHLSMLARQPTLNEAHYIKRLQLTHSPLAKPAN